MVQALLPVSIPTWRSTIPPNGESDTKILPIGKALIIPTTNPHKSPPNPEGSNTAEVNHLLDQAMMEVLSHESKQSSLEKITEAAATTSPPQKSEVMVPPVDTSSQASIEEMEGFLEDIHANISPIAVVYSSRSASPQWTHQSSGLMPTEPLTTCFTSRGP